MSVKVDRSLELPAGANAAAYAAGVGIVVGRVTR